MSTRTTDRGGAGVVEETVRRDQLDDAVRDVLEHDEEVVWRTTPARDAINRMIAMYVGVLFLAILAMLGFFASVAGGIGPMVLILAGLTVAIVLGMLWLLRRSVTGVEVVGTTRRLLVVRDRLVGSGSAAVDWDDIEEIRVKITLPFLDVGTITVDTGAGLAGALFGSGRFGIPLVRDPERVRRELLHLREKYGDAGGR